MASRPVCATALAMPCAMQHWPTSLRYASCRAGQWHPELSEPVAPGEAASGRQSTRRWCWICWDLVLRPSRCSPPFSSGRRLSPVFRELIVEARPHEGCPLRFGATGREAEEQRGTGPEPAEMKASSRFVHNRWRKKDRELKRGGMSQSGPFLSRPVAESLGVGQDE